MLYIKRQNYRIDNVTPAYTVGVFDRQSAGDFDYFRDGQIVMEFKGLQTLLNYVKKYMPEAQHGKDSSDTGRDNFHFFKTYEKALDCYTHNPSKIADFTESDLKLAGGDSAGQKIDFDITGDFLDIGRFMEQTPEIFGVMQGGNPRGRRVTVTYLIDWWHGTNKDYINDRSKKILQLVDWLESQQIRVKLVALKSNECMHLELTVKEFDEPLNINDLAVTSHSDFLRRICFRITEYSDKYSMGYGSAVDCMYAMNGRYSQESSAPLNELEIIIGTERDLDITQIFKKLQINLTEKLSDDITDNAPLKAMV